MSDFKIACDYLMSNEGGFENDKDDKGGLTNFGISIRFLQNLEYETLKECGIIYKDDDSLHHFITNMTLDQAYHIYKICFWDNTYFEKINNQFVTNYYFDTSVNSGIAQATKLVQRALKSLKIDIVEDGILGVNTLEEINHAGLTILPPLRAERANFYRMVVEHNPSQQKFLNGWLIRAYR